MDGGPCLLLQIVFRNAVEREALHVQADQQFAVRLLLDLLHERTCRHRDAADRKDAAFELLFGISRNGGRRGGHRMSRASGFPPNRADMDVDGPDLDVAVRGHIHELASDALSVQEGAVGTAEVGDAERGFRGLKHAVELRDTHERELDRDGFRGADLVLSRRDAQRGVRLSGHFQNDFDHGRNSLPGISSRPTS